MAYLLTEYEVFFEQRINELTTNDADKIKCIKLQMAELKKKLAVEKDYNMRRRLQMEIQVCQLKIMIVPIH